MQKIRIKEFVNYCREQLGLSIHSLRAYEQDLTAFSEFALKAELQSIPTGEEVVAYQKHLREEKNSSPATIRRRLITLRSYFTWLQSKEPNVQSPFQGLRLDLKVPKRLPRPVDRPTLGEVFRSVEHIVNVNPTSATAQPVEVSAVQLTGLVARLLIVTGLRIGEITSLRV